MIPINNAGNINPILPQNLTDLSTSKSKEQVPVVNTANTPADKVEISKQAAIISKAVVALNELPAVRTDLIANATQERVVQDKQIPAELLAQKMLFEDIK